MASSPSPCLHLLFLSGIPETSRFPSVPKPFLARSYFLRPEPLFGFWLLPYLSGRGEPSLANPASRRAAPAFLGGTFLPLPIIQPFPNPARFGQSTAHPQLRIWAPGHPVGGKPELFPGNFRVRTMKIGAVIHPKPFSASPGAAGTMLTALSLSYPRIGAVFCPSNS